MGTWTDMGGTQVCACAASANLKCAAKLCRNEVKNEKEAG